MREFFVVMIKENETTNLKLLTEKLNEGFYIDNRYDVGRSLMITLRRNVYENLETVPSDVEPIRAFQPVPRSTTQYEATDVPF